MVGSPTHPVMPNLVMLWKMGPSRCGRRAGGYNPLVGAAAGRGPLRRPPGEFPCDLTGRRWPGAGGGGQARRQFFTPQELQVCSGLGFAEVRSTSCVAHVPMKHIVYDGLMCHAGVAFVLRYRGAALKLMHVFTTSDRTSELPPESHVPKVRLMYPKFG